MRNNGNAYRIWCENLKERNDFEYLTVRKHNIKTRFKQIVCDSVDFALGKLEVSPKHSNESSDSIL